MSQLRLALSLMTSSPPVRWRHRLLFSKPFTLTQVTNLAVGLQVLSLFIYCLTTDEHLFRTCLLSTIGRTRCSSAYSCVRLAGKFWHTIISRKLTVHSLSYLFPCRSGYL